LTTELREYIRSILSSTLKVDQELVDRIGPSAAHAALTGAFLTAVDRRFDDSPTREEVVAFVAKAREHYVEADSLPPMLGEAMLRAAARGEESLVQGMSAEDLTRSQLMLTYALVHDVGLSGAEYEQFLTDAADYAQELAREQGENGRK
jgi:hypothetical protein